MQRLQHLLGWETASLGCKVYYTTQHTMYIETKNHKTLVLIPLLFDTHTVEIQDEHMEVHTLIRVDSTKDARIICTVRTKADSVEWGMMVLYKNL